MNQGWECPRCGRCYAPWVSECKAHDVTITSATPFIPSVAPNIDPPPSTGDPIPPLHETTCGGTDGR